MTVAAHPALGLDGLGGEAAQDLCRAAELGRGLLRAIPLHELLCTAVGAGPPPLASRRLRHALGDPAQLGDYRGIFQQPGRPATPVTDVLSGIGKSSNRRERVVILKSEEAAGLAQTAEQIRPRHRRDPPLDIPRINPGQPDA